MPYTPSNWAVVNRRRQNQVTASIGIGIEYQYRWP